MSIFRVNGTMLLFTWHMTCTCLHSSVEAAGIHLLHQITNATPLRYNLKYWSWKLLKLKEKSESVSIIFFYCSAVSVSFFFLTSKRNTNSFPQNTGRRLSAPTSTKVQLFRATSRRSPCTVSPASLRVTLFERQSVALRGRGRRVSAALLHRDSL